MIIINNDNNYNNVKERELDILKQTCKGIVTITKKEHLTK